MQFLKSWTQTIVIFSKQVITKKNQRETVSPSSVDFPSLFLGLIKTFNYALWEGTSASLYQSEYKRKIRLTCQNFQLLQRKLNSTYKNKLSQELSSERSCCVASFLPRLYPISPHQERSPLTSSLPTMSKLSKETYLFRVSFCHHIKSRGLSFKV